MSWIRLFSADRLFHYFGPAPLHLMTRLVGILLFALAIDFVLEGVRRTFT